MLGQFFEWFVLGDGVVVVELLDEELVDGVVVVDVEPPLAALAIAAPPPATAPEGTRPPELSEVASAWSVTPFLDDAVEVPPNEPGPRKTRLRKA